MTKQLAVSRIFVVGSIIFFIVMSWLSLQRHATLKTQVNDLGNTAQPLWNTLQGRFMEYSNTADSPQVFHSRFGGHANYIYIFLIPIYALWSDPKVLLLIQVALATMATVPIYLLGQHYFGKNSKLSLVGPVVFWLNPIVHDAVVFDIQAIVLALPFLTTALYALILKKDRLFLISALLLMLCKEDMALLVAMMGVVAMLLQRRFKWGSVIITGALVFFVLNLAVLMPQFPGQADNTLLTDRYGDLGATPWGMIQTGLTNPGAFIIKLLQNQALSYVAVVLLGFAILPVLSLVSLVALPTLMINLLSNNPITIDPFGHYYAVPIVAVFTVSLVHVLGTHPQFAVLSRRRQWSLVVVIVGLLYTWWFSPLPLSRTGNLAVFQSTPHTKLIKEVVALVPPESSLSVQNNLGPHFSNRRELVQFPFRSQTSDYVVVDVTDTYPQLLTEPRQQNFVILTQLFPQDYYDSVMNMFNNPEYGVVYSNDGFLVFQRGTSRDGNLTAWSEFYDRVMTLFAPYESNYPMVYSQPQLYFEPETDGVQLSL